MAFKKAKHNKAARKSDNAIYDCDSFMAEMKNTVS